MQTKQQIQQLLASMDRTPLKRLGQHFLIDLNLMRLLVDQAHIQSDDVILEVGCGTGSLTEALALQAGHVIAVELDPVTAQIAQAQLADCHNAEIINADILASKHRIAPPVLDRIRAARDKYPGRFLLIANLPYHIASPLMINLVSSPTPVDAMTVTLQKEVAERMMATPGTHDYGGLSIILQATGDLEFLRTLRPSVFWPRPQVDSALVSYTYNAAKAALLTNMGLFQKLIGLFMQHRRKMLQAIAKKAALDLDTAVDWPAVFARCDLNPALRPDQLSVQDYVDLARALDQK